MSLEERVIKAEECFKSGDIDNALEMFEDLYYNECDLDSFLEEYVGIYYARCLYAKCEYDKSLEVLKKTIEESAKSRTSFAYSNIEDMVYSEPSSYAELDSMLYYDSARIYSNIYKDYKKAYHYIMCAYSIAPDDEEIQKALKIINRNLFKIN